MDKVKNVSEDWPVVSWLLCTHVADMQLRKALQSCLNQTFTNFELLVITNGPSAKSIADSVQLWFGEDPRIRIFMTEINHLTFSLSLGLHYARGELIARMDGDDVNHINRLERQVAYMRSHPEVAVLGTAYEVIDHNDQALKTVFYPLEDREIRKALLRGNPLCHPTVMFRRSKVLAVGGYLGDIYAQDYDLWSRIALDPSRKFANLREVCLGYRAQGIGQARGARRAYASLAASQLRNFISGAGYKWGLAALLSLAKAFVRKSL